MFFWTGGVICHFVPTWSHASCNLGETKQLYGHISRMLFKDETDRRSGTSDVTCNQFMEEKKKTQKSCDMFCRDCQQPVRPTPRGNAADAHWTGTPGVRGRTFLSWASSGSFQSRCDVFLKSQTSAENHRRGSCPSGAAVCSGHVFQAEILR